MLFGVANRAWTLYDRFTSHRVPVREWAAHCERRDDETAELEYVEQMEALGALALPRGPNDSDPGLQETVDAERLRGVSGGPK